MRDCFIVGSGRSGTSLLAGSLASCGYYFGPRLIKPRTANPKGFFESPAINLLNERLLEPYLAIRTRISSWFYRSHVPGAGQRWLAQLSPSVEAISPPAIQTKICHFLRKRPYCYKDPRFSYTLHCWRQFAVSPACICVFRHPARTVASMLTECREARYLANLDFTEADALNVWCLMYQHILERHSKSGDWLYCHFDQLLTGAGRRSIGEFLGVEPDPLFSDQRLSRSNPVGSVSPLALQIYSELCHRAGYRES